MHKKHVVHPLFEKRQEYARSYEMYLLPALFIVFFAMIITRNGWLCEDSYITFRTVYNFVNGFGLRWNINERVQSFTNPLWTLCISAVFYVTREIHFTTIFVCVAVSVAAVSLVALKFASNRMAMIVVMLGFSLSKAFVDFSTSGLENPLTHLLLAAFLLRYFRLEQNAANEASWADLFWLSLYAALGTVNRMDTGLMFAPPLAYIFWRNVMRRAWFPFHLNKLIAVITGFAPFLLWEGFSLVYYGFLFPNTAYAKLSSGVHPSDRWEQGWYYVLNSLDWDPLTLFVIIGMTFVVVLAYRTRRFDIAVGGSILLYLAYVVRIGGDFMSGRFFTAPFFCAMILLARLPIRPIAQGIPIILVLLLLGLLDPTPTVENYFPEKSRVDNRGISDGLSRDARSSSLARADRHTVLPTNDRVDRALRLRQSGIPVTVEPAIGYFGYAAGPKVHIIDTLALADPLLSRLPTNLLRGEWMIAHFYRPIPDGYIDASVDVGEIRDPSLAAYWQKLRFVTRERLLSRARLHEIVNINRGKYDHWLDEYCLRNYVIEYSDAITEEVEEGSPWNAPENFLLNRYGIGISLKKSRSANASNTYSVSLNGGERYLFAYYRDGQEIARESLIIPKLPTGGMVIQSGVFLPEAVQQHFDMLRIMPDGKPHKHSVGHFRIVAMTITKSLSEMSTPKKQGTPWNDPGNFIFQEYDLLVQLDTISHARRIEISADCNDQYRISFLLNERPVGKSIIREKQTPEGGLTVYQFAVPGDAAQFGYNRLLVTPLGGDGRYSIGHLRFVD